MLRRSKVRGAIWALGLLAFIALFQDFLANGRPLWCRIGNDTFYPGLHLLFHATNDLYDQPLLDSLNQAKAWKDYPYQAAVFAPIPFSPGERHARAGVMHLHPGDIDPSFPRPYRHWLGTDYRGFDVAAGLIGGARIAIYTGALATLMAFGIGLVLGALAGFWGDDRMRLRKGVLWMVLPGLAVAGIYAFAGRQYALIADNSGGALVFSLLLFAGLLLVFIGLGWALSGLPYFSQKQTLPVDLLIMRLAEVFNAVPRLLLVTAAAAVAPRQSLWTLILLVAIFSWTGVARYVRSELLRVRELDFVAAARGMGLSEWRVLLRHALPNALRPALVAFAFAVAGAVLLEASLSFLGYGGEGFEGRSWGSLLMSAKAARSDWWVLLPPAVAICLTVMALHRIGDRLGEIKSA